MAEYLVRCGLMGEVGRFRTSELRHLLRGTRVICRTPRGLEIGSVLNELQRLPPREDHSQAVFHDSSQADSPDNAQTTQPGGMATPRVANQERGTGSAGTVLRRAVPEDELLWARIERDRVAAIDDCQQLLAARNISAVLLDAELLFDGQTMFFYFLGPITPELQQLTDELTATFEARVRLAQFGETLQNGCGPDCGTETGAGCGDSCSSCSIASACKK